MEVVVLGYEIWCNLYFPENFLCYYHSNLSIKISIIKELILEEKLMNTQITAIDFHMLCHASKFIMEKY